MKHFALLPFAFWLFACGEPECPSGTLSINGRCIRSDAGASEADATMLDLDAAHVDASESDASRREDEDACVSRMFWRDSDDDGHGDPSSAMSACTTPEGYVASPGDCDDECPTCFDGADELCDGLDQDCDARIDEELPALVSYADADGDHHGDPSTEEVGCAVGPDRVERGDDCDDQSATRYPGALEACNTVDDDCDTRIDEGVLLTTYRDVDGDGFGMSSMTRMECAISAGYAVASGDCNDDPTMGGASFFPGATEACDERDNDCDTRTDEGVKTTYYRDCDLDGYAPSTEGSYDACQPAGPPRGCDTGGWTSRAPEARTTDCHDGDASAFPGNPSWYTTPIEFGATDVPRWDHNCSGHTERQLESVAGFVCTDFMGRCIGESGWSERVPECGESGTYNSCGLSGFSCGLRSTSRVQECR